MARASFKNIKQSTRSEVLDRVRALDEGKTNTLYRITDIVDWDVSDQNFKMNLGAEEFNFSKWAKQQFLQKLKIPVQYFDQCSTELRNKELREGIQNLSNRGSEMNFKYVERADENYVYGMVPRQYPNLMTAPVVEQFLNNVPDTLLTVEESALDLDELRLRFIYPNSTFGEADPYNPFLDFRFSEVGRTPLMLVPGLWRQVCTNGMMAPVNSTPAFKMPMMRFREDLYLEQLRHIDSLVNGLDVFAGVMEKLKQIQLPKAIIEDDETGGPGIGQKNDFELAYDMVMPSRATRKDYGTLVMKEYNENEDNLTVNGLCNAITRIARDLEDSSEKELLESTAGLFVSKIVSMEKDAIEHNESFDYSMANFDRQFKLAKSHK